MSTPEKENQEPKNQTKAAKHKPALAKKLSLIILYVMSLTVFTSALIHFTNLRFRVPVDPIGAAKTKINQPKERKNNIAQANYHIGEAERLTKWLNEQGVDNQTEGHGDNAHAQTYKDMLAHNDQATRHMLLAEGLGVDLKQEGLIKRLCDSLRDQYLLITSKDPSAIKESETLNARVNKGEDLQVVFDQIQEQLQFAMSW